MSKLLETLHGRTLTPPPVWLMRQAGRYLPEYRALRQQAGSFLDLCFNPEFASEVTLQPIRRFDFDAAIIFADILLIPHALGRNLRFVAGEGPQMDAISSAFDLADKNCGAVLDPVYAALRRVRTELSPDKSLIGFCGGAFTVACYMIAGGRSADFAVVAAYAQRDRADFLRVLDIIVEHSIPYLCQQIAAGADVLQIFESWAELVSAADWQDFIIAPTQKMITGVKQLYPNVPIIAFPRGAGDKYTGYAVATGAQAVGLDQGISLNQASALQNETIVQGNLDPAILVRGGATQSKAVQAIKTRLGHHPYIFNLGHGIVPETPPDHVAELVKQVRES
jgi:uroporphyrinogen decarboxylase